MKINKILVGFSILVLVTIIGIFSFEYFNQKEVEIDGQDIYDALELDNCYRLYIDSLTYVDEGKLKGEEKSFVFREGDKAKILSLIKSTPSDSIEIVNYGPGVFDLITHRFQFNISTKSNVQADYSIITNQLLITESELSSNSNLIKPNPPFTKAIIINMDNQFKNIIDNLQ